MADLLSGVAKTATYTVLRDTIQPFPTFSEIYVEALKSLHSAVTAGRRERVAP